MRKTVVFCFLVLLVMLFAVNVYGADYFLYDGETNKILYMGAKDSTFTERIQMEKKPQLMMPTANPQKFLAIFLPDTDPWAGKGFSLFKRKNTVEKIPGQLVLFNISTGRTEDLVTLGYAPFNWEYTEDRKHFFITYRTVVDDFNVPLELLHYDLTTQKSEKTTLPSQIKTVNQIILNPEANKLYVLGDNNLFHQSVLWIPGLSGKSKPTITGSPELTTFGYSPLSLSGSLPLNYTPLGFYLLSKDRGVLLAQNYKITANGTERNEGTIQYLDLQANTVIDEQPVDFGRIYTHWFKKEKILGLIGYQKKILNVMKITADSFRKDQIKNNFAVCDYEYLPDKDSFYILLKEEFQVVDYKANVINQYDTDSNWYKNMPYSMYRIPGSDLVVLYCFEGGKVKFYDLAENKLITKVSCGRSGVKMFKSFMGAIFDVDNSSDTVVTTDPDKNNFYIFNRLSNDITVYDSGFQSKSYIVLPEQGLGMYMIKKPVLQTIVVSNKNIYQLDYATQTLNPICPLKEKAEDMFLFEDQNRIILTTDRELVVLDPASLTVKYQVSYYSDKKEQYTKIKPGDQRYDFVITL